MDFKLILSTFFVIFLAELGDKTQFAAMAASAGSNKPFSILIGAVLALALSSIIAVAAGAVIGKLIPLKYIKMAAGVLFIIFGLLYIRESFVPEKIHEEKIEISSGFIQTSIMKAAESFENAELTMLTAAREQIEDSGCRTIIDEIIKEEEGHLLILGGMEPDNNAELAKLDEKLTDYQLLIKTLDCNGDDEDTLKDIHEREEAMADFYRIMSEKSRIGSVTTALRRLHHEERIHAEKIRRLIEQV